MKVMVFKVERLTLVAVLSSSVGFSESCMRVPEIRIGVLLRGGDYGPGSCMLMTQLKINCWGGRIKLITAPLNGK